MGYIKPVGINGDYNPTFVIEDPMKTIYMSNKKSLLNSTSTIYFVPCYGV
jgi:hypothetical protein